MTTVIHVCDTCRWSAEEKTAPDGRTGGEIMAEAVAAAAAGLDGVEVRRQSCLMGCERHCNVAVSAPGKMAYVLGKFEPERAAEEAEAVAEYAAAHAASETGVVPFRQWPQGVKGHFQARIPPLVAEPAVPDLGL